MKPAILITSHPNIPEKEYILKDFGRFISQYGIDHYLFSNYPANKDTQKEFKETHYINYNPKDPNTHLSWSAWASFPQIGLKHNHFIDNWCFSGTSLMLKGLKYLKFLGYTHVYTFIYDTAPNYSEIKSFIDLSNQTFNEGKKAIFYEYHLNNGLYNHIYSGELEFLVKLFTEIVENYNSKNLIFNEKPLCENYWEYMTRPYQDLIKFLPKEQIIDSIYKSSQFNKFPNGIDFWVGRHNNKTLFCTRQYLPDFSLLDSNNNLIEYTFIHRDQNLTSFEFDSVIGESYILDKFLILSDTENWRQSDIYTNI
jgi:hypothetical protein